MHYEAELGSVEPQCLAHCIGCLDSECTGRDGCPIEICECGARMHNCKINDHKNLICYSQLTQCINHTNGCNEIILRKDISKHLKTCPLNNYYCYECADTHRSDFDHHEEQFTTAFSNKACSCEEITCKCGLTMKRCRFKNHEAYICPSYIIDCVNKNNGCPEKVCRSEMRTHLMKCPANTFICLDCNELTRRSDADHHSDLFSVNDKARTFNNLCPYRIYGCEFNALDEQLTEDSIKWRVDDRTHQLVLTSHPAMVPIESKNLFLNLPMDAIHEILNYLDGIALNSLSKVSKHCRKICTSVLRKKGIVRLKWSFDEVTKKWKNRNMWSFTCTSDGPPAKIKPTNVIAKHLEACTVNHKMKPNYAAELPQRICVIPKQEIQ